MVVEKWIEFEFRWQRLKWVNIAPFAGPVFHTLLSCPGFPANLEIVFSCFNNEKFRINLLLSKSNGPKNGQ